MGSIYRALMNGIDAFYERDPTELAHPSHHMRYKVNIVTCERGPSPDCAEILMSVFQPTELREINFWCL